MGVHVEQPRAQNDKTSIQTFTYKIKIKNRTIYVENLYCIPKASDENIEVLTRHMENQSKLYKYYMIGGDFNLNWKDKKVRDLFKTHQCPNLSKIIREYRITDVTIGIVYQNPE